MTRRVTARACANIALVKYWGKRDERRNTPATPSISLALSGLTTTTTVERFGDDPSEMPDHVELNGDAARGDSGARVAGYISLWRDLGLIDGAYAVYSQNDFPTGTGLASSSSGFAALAAALAEFSEQKLNAVNLSRLARRGSGSAARSIAGGIAALPSTSDPAARRLVEPNDVPWGMVVAIVETAPKTVGSTEGMNLSRSTSPYYGSWVTIAKHDYRAMLSAIRDRDLVRTGELAESNCYAMQACMLTTHPPLLYWNEVTTRLMRRVLAWRREGVRVYATADAGPHVCFLADRADLDALAGKAASVEGVTDVNVSLPGAPAEVVSKE
ncbi:MAG: hypothetical protein MAG453_00628 [Calditrichaeota bacterium]|nr:hypothetical protein [Calditrichota bacterium]